MTAFSIDRVFSSAEKELQAFLEAIAEVFGPDKIKRASCLWIETLENTWELNGDPESFFRRITIQAASQMAATTHSNGDANADCRVSRTGPS